MTISGRNTNVSEKMSACLDICNVFYLLEILVTEEVFHVDAISTYGFNNTLNVECFKLCVFAATFRFIVLKLKL